MVFGLQMQEAEYTEYGVADSRQLSVLNCSWGEGRGWIKGKLWDEETYIKLKVCGKSTVPPHLPAQNHREHTEHMCNLAQIYFISCVSSISEC